MSGPTTLLPFQLATMTIAQLAAVSFLARLLRAHSQPLRLPVAGVVLLV